MNRVIFVGNLASDVETRMTNSGSTCALFRLAVQRIRSNKDGKREADFFPVVAWGKTAELCVRFLSKGGKVAIDGRLQTRTYNAQDGSKRYITEAIADRVEFLSYAQGHGGHQEDAGQHVEASMETFEDYEDDLPF